MSFTIMLLITSAVCFWISISMLLNGGLYFKKRIYIFIYALIITFTNLARAFYSLSGTAQSARSGEIFAAVSAIFLFSFLSYYIARTLPIKAKLINFATFILMFLSIITYVFHIRNGSHLFATLICVVSTIFTLAILIYSRKKIEYKRDILQLKITIAVVAILEAYVLYHAILFENFNYATLIHFLIFLIFYYFFQFKNLSDFTSIDVGRYIFLQVNTPIVFVAQNGNVTLANKSAGEFFDYAQIDVQNNNIAELFNFKTGFETIAKTKGNGNFTNNYDVTSKFGGEICSLDVTYVYDKFDEIICAVFIINDVTDKIKLIEELNESRAEAELANQTKGSFLANMSHEIRTPMNAIIGMSEILLQGELPEESRRYAHNIKTAGNGLVEIINDILDFSKIESGKFEMLNMKYLLSSLLADVINIISIRLRDKDIYFVVDVNPQLPNELLGDEVRIKQVLTNILGNAVKFTQSGFIRLSVEGELNHDELQFKIIVQDTGIGIKDEEIGKLFGVFSQLDTRRNRAITGTGLGLSITKNLLELMGGGISIKSVYGAGSQFCMTYKQTVANNSPIAEPLDDQNIHVLVFEFEQVLIDSIEYALNGLSVWFDTCTNYDEFAYLLKTKKYTHIFTRKLNIDAVENLRFECEFKAQIVLILNTNENPTGNVNYKELYLPLYYIQIVNILKNIDVNYYNEEVQQKVCPIENARVLIVDDNQVNLEVARGLMVPYKLNIDTATSGDQAIKMILANVYDLVFMDHMMPIKDGIDTTKEIREMDSEYCKNLPIVALTANAMRSAEETFMASGFSGFLAKPIELSKLHFILNFWLKKDIEMGIVEPTASEQPAEIALMFANFKAINYKQGLEFLGNDLKTYCKVLSIFYQDMLPKSDQLTETFQTKDWHLFTNCAHGIKGISANIGANRLSIIARNLEDAGNTNDENFICANLQALKDEIAIVLAELVEHFKRQKNDIEKELAALDYGLLISLRRACEMFETDEAQSILETILQKDYDKEIMDVLKEIQRQLELFNFDEVMELIDKMRDMTIRT